MGFDPFLQGNFVSRISSLRVRLKSAKDEYRQHRETCIDNHRTQQKPIWGWLSGWLGILEFAPPEVSGSILSGANFGGLSPYRDCSGLKRDPCK
ncbi:hypothetical protein MTR_7g451270 [Medicago truncatula]|uniref:Uncharacterized protein n=1 Tax=Medicago truncatula TaxID=3880 RepID=A0A072U9J5_MEDTR|nr:hypothetical protein MTR_7g451270 [Medicago truncatula]